MSSDADSLDPNSFHHFTAKVNGINLHYIEEGSGNRSIVLCHGWPDLWYGWRRQIKPLARAGYRVIVPDLRGFGGTDGLKTPQLLTPPHCLGLEVVGRCCWRIGSRALHSNFNPETMVKEVPVWLTPAESESYSFREITNDMAALLDHLKIGRAVFLGHDWGGEVVWKMCLYHPSRVLAVGAFCTPFFERIEEFVPLDELIKIFPAFQYQAYLISEQAPRDLNAEPERFFRNVFRAWDSAESPGGRVMMKNRDPNRCKMLSQMELDYYVEQYKKRRFEGSLNYYKTRELNWTLEAPLPTRIDHIPALMVTAGKDAILSPALADDMKSRISQLTTRHIENAAHWILVEQWQEVNKILLRWLQTAVAPASKI